MSKGYVIKKDKSILYDGILNRLSNEWFIEKVNIYDKNWLSNI
jgi:hypothetical protein